MVVTINETKCNGVDACPSGGLCIEICALNAMENINGRPIPNDSCPDCGLCVMNCPNEAISKP